MSYVILDETNNTYIRPPKDTYTSTNYDLDTEQLINDGYIDISDDLLCLIDSGKGLVQNGTIIDISNTVEYIQGQKDEQIENIMAEQVEILTQFDITWSRNVILGLKTAAQMSTARNAVKADYAQKISEVQNG